MGWLFMPFTSMGGHTTAKSYLDAQLTYENTLEDGTKRGLRVLASSCPGNRTYYAAVQEMVEGVPGTVLAIVCLVRWNPRSRDGHQFGYKDMSENMGPCEADCPASILDLLSPTTNEYAIDWRARCRENLARRARKLQDGDRIRLRDPANGCFYRISRLMQRAWSIVPVTKIHKTVFA